VHLKDAADDSAVGKHIKIVVVPLAGRPACRCVFKDQVVLLHQPSPAPLRPHNVLIESPLRLENRIKKPADRLTPVRLWFRLSVYPSVELRPARNQGVLSHCRFDRSFRLIA